MDSKLKTVTLHIGGMTCANCQNRIEKKLLGTAGVYKAVVSYSGETATVTYDTAVTKQNDIEEAVKTLNYDILKEKASPVNPKHAIGILVIILALFMLMRQSGLTAIFNIFPTAEAGTDSGGLAGYGMLFVIGLLTSVHCLAMCGGINLSQCIPRRSRGKDGDSRFAALRPGLLYNTGRVVSYTVIGGIVGLLGSAVSFSGELRGVVQLVAGVFMVVMGINMLGIFPSLRKFMPRMPRVFARKIESEKGKNNSPLYVGLLNGLMPCGPLQAMQLYALSTGSPFKGALSMLLFSLGTVPLVFGLGALSSVLSGKFTRKVMTAGAALVFALGIGMFSNGLSLSGMSLNFVGANSDGYSRTVSSAKVGVQSSANSGVVVENGVQLVNSELRGGRYPAVTVAVGIPVKWTINAPQGSINGCNKRMVIPEYGIEYQFKTGDNVIEFTPEKTGEFPYSCWMGMIRSSINVVKSDTTVSDTTISDTAASDTTVSDTAVSDTAATDTAATDTAASDTAATDTAAPAIVYYETSGTSANSESSSEIIPGESGYYGNGTGFDAGGYYGGGAGFDAGEYYGGGAYDFDESDYYVGEDGIPSCH